MGWSKPLKIIQMVLASVALLMTCYGAVVFMVNPGFALSWLSFGWTLMFSVLRVYNRQHDTRNWRGISIGLDITSDVFWMLATAFLAKDSAWLAEGRTTKLLKGSDPRLDYVYKGYGLAALYVCYAVTALAGAIFVTFLATGSEGLSRWRAPLERYEKRDKDVGLAYNPLQQYDVPKHWNGDSSGVRHV